MQKKSITIFNLSAPTKQERSRKGRHRKKLIVHLASPVQVLFTHLFSNNLTYPSRKMKKINQWLSNFILFS